MAVAVLAAPFAIGAVHRLLTPSEAAARERLAATLTAVEAWAGAAIDRAALTEWECDEGYSGFSTVDGEIICIMKLEGSYPETMLDHLDEAARAAGGSAVPRYRTGDPYRLSSPPPSRSTIRLNDESELYEFNVYWYGGTDSMSLRIETEVFIRD